MNTQSTALEVATAAQCEILRNHARAFDAPDRLTRDEEQALCELRNEKAQEAGVELVDAITAAGQHMWKHEPMVMRKLCVFAGIDPQPTLMHYHGKKGANPRTVL